MKFSVLISVYHKENPEVFKSAIDSLLIQTLLPTEIVLVKDGPLTPQLDSIIENLINENNKLFVIVAIKINQGLGNALKVGLDYCKYEFVARMDTDDICYPDRFERQIAFLKQNPHIDVLGTNVEEFNKVPGDLKTFRILPKEGEQLKRYSKYRSPVNHPSIIFRKQAVINSGNYNNEILLFEDYVLFIKMMNNGYIFYNIQEVLLNFRVGSGIESIKRRSGVHYIKSELKFVDFAHKIGHLSYLEKLSYLIMKIPIRLLPPKVVLFVYKTFLRKKI